MMVKSGLEKNLFEIPPCAKPFFGIFFSNFVRFEQFCNKKEKERFVFYVVAFDPSKIQNFTNLKTTIGISVV